MATAKRMLALVALVAIIAVGGFIPANRAVAAQKKKQNKNQKKQTKPAAGNASKTAKSALVKSATRNFNEATKEREKASEQLREAQRLRDRLLREAEIEKRKLSKEEILAAAPRKWPAPFSFSRAGPPRW